MGHPLIFFVDIFVFVIVSVVIGGLQRH